MDRVFWRYGAGLVVALAAGIGLLQSVRASWAYAVMYEARFGDSRKEPDTVLELSRLAHRKYPFSYQFAGYAGRVAWDQYVDADEAGDAERAARYLEQVRRWTRIGLHRNPYLLRLRWLHTQLLEIDDSIDAAIEYWEKHTDWQFWYAYNHAVLAELYIAAGRFDDAARSLKMLRGSPYYAETVADLKAARAIVEQDGETAAPN